MISSYYVSYDASILVILDLNNVIYYLKYNAGSSLFENKIQIGTLNGMNNIIMSKDNSVIVIYNSNQLDIYVYKYIFYTNTIFDNIIYRINVLYI